MDASLFKDRTAPDRLRRWERWGLALVALLLVAFAGIAELRGAYQHTRKTDFGVYLRAAYAVRTGGDIYKATDNNGYHYIYPPAFAIVITPLADAPDGAPRDGLLPYPISVAIWIVLNYILVARIVHVLASLVLPNETRGSRRWWYARLVPFYIAFGGLLHSIGYGQVNVVLIALLVEMLRSRISGKSLQSGCWLAAAIVIKVFPAYLLLYPLMMRDRRAIAGAALGLFVGLAALPVAVLGVQRTEAAYVSLSNRLLLPGAVGIDTQNDLTEILDMAADDPHSFMGLIHNYMHQDIHNYPPLPSKNERLAHNIISAVVTLVTLFAAWRGGLGAPAAEVIFAGTLMLLMFHITPMSHIHYYAFGVVLVAGLYLHGLIKARGIWPGWRVMLPLVIWGVGTTSLHIPLTPFETLRFYGIGLACSMLLWVAALMTLSDRPQMLWRQAPNNPVRA